VDRFIELVSEKLPIPITELTQIPLVYEKYPDFFGRKKILFIIDEFQAFLLLEKEIIQRVFLQLKSIVGGVVHTLIGVGTFSLRQIQEEFSVSRTCSISPFSPEAISTFFQSWANDRKFTIEPEIYNHVYNFTIGYAGLVGCIAFYLQDILYSDPTIREKGITYLDYTTTHFPAILQQMSGYYQFRRVTKWAEEKAHQHFIFKYIIASYRVNTQIDLDLAKLVHYIRSKNLRQS